MDSRPLKQHNRDQRFVGILQQRHTSPSNVRANRHTMDTHAHYLANVVAAKGKTVWQLSMAALRVSEVKPGDGALAICASVVL